MKDVLLPLPSLCLLSFALLHMDTENSTLGTSSHLTTGQSFTLVGGWGKGIRGISIVISFI